jgi:multidrug efflux pump subunit AcrA (membrane-fusion protein)
VSFLAGDGYPGAARSQAAAWTQRSREQPWAGPGADPGYYEAPYPERGYPDPGYPDPAYYDPAYDDPAYYEAAPGQEAYGPGGYYQDPSYYQDPPGGYQDPPDAYWGPPEPPRPVDAGDGFAGEPEPDAYLDDIPAPPPPRPRPSRPRPPARPRRGGRRNRRSLGPKRLAGIVVAAASVVGVALLAPRILTAAKNETLTGVVTQSSLDNLNFAAAGRVARIRVRLGQVVRKGQLLAREMAPAGGLSAPRTDRAAIVADKADLAALTAAGAPIASVNAARAQLATDQEQRAADQAAMAIRAPMAGTVVAVFGRTGVAASPAGLPAPGQLPAATQLSAFTVASLHGGGRKLPVIELRTSSPVQVRLSIPAESPAALRVGSAVKLSVPAAQLTRVTGVITALAPSAGGGKVAVIQLSGTVPATVLTGMRATAYLSS